MGAIHLEGLLPGPLGPFQALSLSALLRQDLAQDCGLGRWPARLLLCPLLAGPGALLSSPCPTTPRWEVATFFSLEAAWRPRSSQSWGAQKPRGTNLAPQGEASDALISPICLHCQDRTPPGLLIITPGS